MALNGTAQQFPVACVHVSLGHYNQVQSAQPVLPAAKTFADHAFDCIPTHRGMQPFCRYCETQARQAHTVGPREHYEHGITDAMAGIEDSLEISGRPESAFWRETPGLGGHNNFRVSGAFYPWHAGP